MGKQFKTLWLYWAITIFLVVPAWGMEAGDPLPDFTVPTFDGRQLTTSDLMGRPSLLVFWNTWCAICMHELPQLNRLNASLGQQKITVLAVNTAINDSEKKARAYQAKQKFDFAFTFDSYFEMGQAFGIRGVPTIFLIDARGVVSDKFTQIPDNLKTRILQLHGEAPASGAISNN